MDPTTCLKAFHDALLTDPPDYQEAANRAEDLFIWLERGGFAPDYERVRTESLNAAYETYTSSNTTTNLENS